MARGRMINSVICSDKRVNDLTDDTSRLAFTWLITFADREGRTHGDPVLLCSMLFPRRRDVTPERMEGYIREWASIGLVLWYEANDDLWLEFPAFDRNQPGLRKDREPVSCIPTPEDGTIIAGCLPDECRMNGGDEPEECPPKRTEQKRTETKAFAADFADAAPSDPVAVGIRAYENAIGLLSGVRQSEEIGMTLRELHARGLDDWWQTSIDIAVDNNKRSWAYIKGILENHLRDGTAPVHTGGPLRAPPKAEKKRIKVRETDGTVREVEATI